MTVLLIATGAMSLAVLAARWNRRCRQCRAATINLQTPEECTWELLWCEACRWPAVMAAGRQDALAWCPSCLQRSLEVSLPQPDAESLASDQLTIVEQCHLCGLERTHELEALAAPRGLVLPFSEARRSRR